MEVHVRVLKEPRGFVRVVQFLMSIFAFSTTAGYSGASSVKMRCGEAKEETVINMTFGYPFSRIEVDEVDLCTKLKNLEYGYSFASSAQFFVATGVLAFLFTLAITALYIMFTKMYSSNQLVPIVDLGVTGVLTLFWLASSCAWAQGVSDLKYYTNPNNFNRIIKCSPDCDPILMPNYAGLNVSLIFGFANVALWAASMWFVYKETVFHLQRTQQAMQPAAQQQQPPMPPQSQSPPSGVQSPEAYKY